MVRKRVRRKSGYVTPNLTVSKRDLIKYDLVVNPIYDDWCDWRDGIRDWFRDFKLIRRIPWKTSGRYNKETWEKRMRMNQKQERLLKRRKSRCIKRFECP